MNMGAYRMRILGYLMAANAALFFFGAAQHTGIEIGPFAEPRIIPAAIVESICGIALIVGALAALGGGAHARLAALIGNLVAIAGVSLGMIALAAGRGPRTASNDLYHRIMLLLAAAALALLFTRRRRAELPSQSGT